MLVLLVVEFLFDSELLFIVVVNFVSDSESVLILVLFVISDCVDKFSVTVVSEIFSEFSSCFFQAVQDNTTLASKIANINFLLINMHRLFKFKILLIKQMTSRKPDKNFLKVMKFVIYHKNKYLI